MSEQSMGQEMATPRERATQYLQMRQGEMRNGWLGKGEKKVKTGTLAPFPKVERTTPLIESVTAYEKIIDNLTAKGYEGAAQKLADLRPLAYDTARFTQWTARVVDKYAIPALLWLPDKSVAWMKMPSDIKKPLTLDKRIIDTGIMQAERSHFSIRALTTVGVLRFRPMEYIGAKAAQLGGAVLSSDAVAPIVNLILQGGERVQKTPDVTPMTPAAT